VLLHRAHAKRVSQPQNFRLLARTRKIFEQSANPCGGSPIPKSQIDNLIFDTANRETVLVIVESTVYFRIIGIQGSYHGGNYRTVSMTKRGRVTHIVVISQGSDGAAGQPKNRLRWWRDIRADPVGCADFLTYRLHQYHASQLIGLGLAHPRYISNCFTRISRNMPAGRSYVTASFTATSYTSGRKWQTLSASVIVFAIGSGSLNPSMCRCRYVGMASPLRVMVPSGFRIHTWCR